ncbi:16S rRNA (uracil(1498)-N(3))-methyltransferase [Halochromatium sp.]
MRENRLYTEQPLDIGELIELEPRPTKHAVQVLRLGSGDPLTLFNGDGRDYNGEIETSTRNQVRVRIHSASPPEPNPPLAIRLALGVSRGERMDLALQKAVELGVSSIQPLFSSRTLVRLSGDRLAKRAQHWQGVIIAACEQSGRRRLPTLAPALALLDWLQQQQDGGILLHHEAAKAITELRYPQLGQQTDHPAGQQAEQKAEQQSSQETAQPAGRQAEQHGGQQAAQPAGRHAEQQPVHQPWPRGRLTLLIGPEGGLEPAERDYAQAQGFTPVRLGPRVLRTETAPLAAIAAIQTLWGDFRG